MLSTSPVSSPVRARWSPLRLGLPCILTLFWGMAAGPVTAQDAPVGAPPEAPAAAPVNTPNPETIPVPDPIAQPETEPPAAPEPRHRPKAGELFPFVLPWDDASDSVMNLSSWNSGPAGRNGFIFAREGRIWEPSAGEGPTAQLTAGAEPPTAEPRRMRFLGVNLCFDGNFPTKEDAPKIAARMAKFGINCVRFHHMDFSPAPNGIFQEDMKALDPEMLDRLDFFIAELKRRGIYSNINLHVSRTYPGFPKWEGGPSFHKGLDQFHPELIQMQKDFARDLLTHLNPYTQTRYLDEPAIAIVEINNENGLLWEWNTGNLDGMPEVYSSVLNRQWNRFLLNKYAAEMSAAQDPAAPPAEPGAPAAPRTLGPKAWGIADLPLGENLLEPHYSKWHMEQHGGAQANLIANVSPAMPDGSTSGEELGTVKIVKPGKENWHSQLTHGGIVLESGQPYTISLEIGGGGGMPPKVMVALGQASEPWKVLASKELAVPADLKKYTFTLTPTQGAEQGRMVISGMGTAPAGARLELRNITLQRGGTRGVNLVEGGRQLRFLKKSEFSQGTVAQKQDWLEFLWETEDAYWREMDRYLREELGVESLLIGTQANVFSNSALQNRFPIIDTHGYWEHPQFPGEDWDRGNWTVKNVPMSPKTNGGTLSLLGINRVKDKPFMVTEYNHAAPNSYAAEAFPLLAAFAAWQDWDGIFPFAYSHGGPWDTRHINSFFDIKQDPIKMATLPMAAALFLRGDMVAPERETVGPISHAEFRAAMMGGSTVVDASNFGIERELLSQKRVDMVIGDREGTTPDSREVPAVPEDAAPAVDAPPTPETTAPMLRYEKPLKGEQSLVLVAAPRSKAVIGHTQKGTFDLGDGVKVSGVDSRLPDDFAVVTLSQMTGEQIGKPGRILVLALGEQQTTDQKWVDEKTKNSVGKNWGKAPSLVEGVSAVLTLPVAKEALQAWSLDELGQPIEPLPIEGGKDSSTIHLKPEYGTIWYEVVVQ